MCYSFGRHQWMFGEQWWLFQHLYKHPWVIHVYLQHRIWVRSWWKNLPWWVNNNLRSHNFHGCLNHLLRLTDDCNTSCIDTDECAGGTHVCDQGCTNTVGSYTCSCGTGYRLNGNGYQCDGEHLRYNIIIWPWIGDSNYAKRYIKLVV